MLHRNNKIFYGWVVVAAAWISTFVCSVALGSFNVFLLELTRPVAEGGLGATRGMLSGAYSLNVMVVAIFALAAGMLMDRVGIRRIMIIGAVVAFIGFVLLSRTNHIWQFYVFYGLIAPSGVALAHMVPSIATVRRWFMRRAALAVGVAMTGSGLGVVVLIPVIYIVIGNIGWQNSYLVIGAIILAGATVAAMLMKKDPESFGTHPDGMQPTEEEMSSRSDFASRAHQWSVRKAIKTRTWWMLLFAQFYSISVLGFIGHIAIWGRDDVMVSEGTAVIMVSVLVGAAVLSRIIAGALSDWTMKRFNVTRKPSLYICTFLVALGCFAAIWVGAGNAAGLAAVAVLVGLGYGIGLAMFPTYLGDLFGVKVVPALFGVMYLFSAGIFAASGPSLYGVIYDAFGSYDIAFIITAVLCLVSAVSLYMVQPPKMPVDKNVTSIQASV